MLKALLFSLTPAGRRVLISTAALFATISFITPAAAQDEDALEEVIVVKGYRGSLKQGLNLKRNETAATDSIVAEDIADFPDLNIAESLQRIAGVSIARDAGEGRNITVRGLGPTFTRVRINGMEALSTEGGTDSSGGTNRDRGFDFNTFASELFNRVTVRKTATADIDEGSLGATVDLYTARPFDYEGFQFTASGQGGFNDLSGTFDPRMAMLVSNTFMDGRFGALLSIAYAERDLVEEGHSTVRWQNGNLSCPVCNSLPTAAERTAANAEVDLAFTPRLPRYGILEHEQDRLGITGALQWQATDATLFTFEALYADHDSDRTENFLEAPDFSAGGGGGRAGIDVLDYEIDADNDMTFGRFDDVDVRAESRLDRLGTEFQQYTLKGEHEISDTIRIDGLVGYSNSDHDNPTQTTLLWDRVDTDGYVYDYRDDDRLPLITYGFDTSNPASYNLTQIRLRPQTAENTYWNFELNGEWDMMDGLVGKAGLTYKQYEFETTELRRSNGTTANLEGSVAGQSGTPRADYAKVIEFEDNWDLPDGSVFSWVIPDVKAAEDLFGLNDPALFPLGPEPALGNNRGVEEDNAGGFVQFDFETELGSVPLRGNFGFRYVRTRQESRGFEVTQNVPTEVTVVRHYDNMLPSLNLVIEPYENLLVRAAYARVVSRPGLGSLTPGGTVSVSGNNRTVNFGNPDLDPFEADALDLSFEWYFQEEALASAAVFYKDISTFPQSVSETRPFTGNSFGLPDSVAIAACGTVAGCTPAAQWVFTRPQNSDGGGLLGFELTYQQTFRFLPGFLSNLGVIGNYTHVDSDIDYIDPSSPTGITTADLVGLSKNAYSATLYYDDSRINLRGSVAYRDDYLQTVPGRNGNDVEGTNGTFNVDVAASYNFNEQFTITFEGINLTDEVSDQFVDSTDRVFVYHHTGRYFFFGGRYTY